MAKKKDYKEIVEGNSIEIANLLEAKGVTAVECTAIFGNLTSACFAQMKKENPREVVDKTFEKFIKQLRNCYDHH